MSVERKIYTDPLKRIEQLESLASASKIINSSLDLAEILSRIMNLTTELLDADRSTLYLIDKEKGELWSIVAQGLDQIEIRLPLNQGIAGHVATNLKTLNVKDAYELPFFNREFDKKSNYRTKSVLCIPMINKEDKAVGVMQVLNKKHGDFIPDDEEFLYALSDHAVIAIENAIMHKDLIAKKKLEEELLIAHKIQKSILPDTVPSVTGYDFGAINVSAKIVGGDFYDFIPLHAGKWGLVMADVSDKGMPAAIFMAVCRTVMRAVAKDNDSAAEVLRMANALISEIHTSNMFVTLFYGILDTKERRLVYSNAGHNPPLLYNVNRGEYRYIEMEGTAIGVMDGIEFEEDSIDMQKDDLLVLYTDGITEAINPQEDEFGLDRMIDVLKNKGRNPARDIVENIEKAVDTFASGQPQFDDMTLMV
ncbi:MAG: GAF domain-containing SpoIIE family protein phosphatase, partial [Nitrospirota bacterium]